LDNGDSYSPLATGDDLDPEMFPYQWTISAAFFHQFVPIPRSAVRPPEFVYVPMPSRGTPRFATFGRLVFRIRNRVNISHGTLPGGSRGQSRAPDRAQ
jgi:hypothetical protein